MWVGQNSLVLNTELIFKFTQLNYLDDTTLFTFEFPAGADFDTEDGFLLPLSGDNLDPTNLEFWIGIGTDAAVEKTVTFS